MTKAILLDFWGTLVDNGVRSPIKQVKYTFDIRLPFSQYVVRLENAMMKKQFANLTDAFEMVCQEFKVDHKQVENMVGMWNKNWMLAAPYPDTIQGLEELQSKYKLILISNTDNFSVPNVLEKFNLKKYFHDIVLSCEVGSLKTEPQFIQSILEKHGLKKEDCVLVGDSLLSDIQAATAAQIKGILIDRRNTREFKPKITSLLELKDHL